MTLFEQMRAGIRVEDFAAGMQRYGQLIFAAPLLGLGEMRKVLFRRERGNARCRVGGAYDVGDALVHGAQNHLLRILPRLRAVVYTVDEMVMNVNEHDIAFPDFNEFIKCASRWRR